MRRACLLKGGGSSCSVESTHKRLFLPLKFRLFHRLFHCLIFLHHARLGEKELFPTVNAGI